MGDAAAAVNEKSRKPGDETEDQSIYGDEGDAADDHARKQGRAEKGIELSGRHDCWCGGWWRKRAMLPGNFLFDRLQKGFRFIIAANGLKPAGGFKQGFAKIPDHQSADSSDDEHGAPTKYRNDQSAYQRRGGQAKNDDKGHAAQPFSSCLRGDELRHGGIADDIFRAETEAHDEAQEYQHMNIGGESRG